jgi:hypothetical protein
MYRRPAVFVLWFWLLVALATSTNAEERCIPAAFFSCRVTAYEGLTDKTLRFDSTEYGSGAFYLAPDGRAFLWIVGEFQVRSGFWMAETIRETRPSATSSEPTTRSFDLFMMQFSSPRSRSELFHGNGGQISFLIEDLDTKLGVREKVDHDILQLSSGTVPCRLCRPGRSISDLLEGRTQ